MARIKVKMAYLEFVRAGSDYLPGQWSCNVRGMAFKIGAHYDIERPDGTTYEVRAARMEMMDGKSTTLLIAVE